VDGGDVPSEEPLGTKEKFWVSDTHGQPWLFKYARDHAGDVRGEDWAECLVHDMATLIGVPTATIRLAVCHGRRGVLSRSVVRPQEQLEHGNELLARIDPEYDSTERRENLGYNVAAIKQSLDQIGPPGEWPDLAEFMAYDVWCGYLVLDAWVAGRDRHHENWAAVTDGSTRRLAPSFDHGNALGFQESEAEYARLAASATRLVRWARKGRSPHFAGRPALVDVARSALTAASSQASQYWLHRLDDVDPDQVAAAVDQVPRELLSEEGHNFCLKLLMLNRERMLRGDQDIA
jgi:hypothetical protein